MSFASIWTQIFPPRNGAPLTEANLPSQAGKVFVVTGGSSGLGYQLSRILHGAGAKVYMLTRTKKNAEDAIARIKAHYGDGDGDGDGDSKAAAAGNGGRGTLEFIYIDIRRGLSEDGGRLDVLFNNAGTGAVKNAPKSSQGCEYHFCANSVGHYLLTRLLTPLLAKTAAARAPGDNDTVRVVWPASFLVEAMSPKGGIRKTFLEDPESLKNENELYASSKTANWFLASEFARRQAGSSGGTAEPGVVHIAGNPGNYVTNIWRSVPAWTYYAVRPILRDAVHGAETYLWMAFSESVTLEEAVAGRYAICDGRWHPGQREDLLQALKSVEEGGSGRASQYYDWCEARVVDFVT